MHALGPWLLSCAGAALAQGPASASAPGTAPPLVRVADREQLRAALAAARAGSVIELAPGDYAGGLHCAGLRGSAERPIELRSADPARPAAFRGGACGLQLPGAEHVLLADLVFEGQSGNGLNLDDGGARTAPARDLVLRRLRVREIGPRGNCDGIKLSGVAGFAIEDCAIERWGSGGSGIDLVGCSQGQIARCTLSNPPERATASGIQIKGGSHAISIRRNRFENAGERALNLGGSTGLEYFRPPLEGRAPPYFEAQQLSVLGNTIAGSEAALACVGAEGVQMRFNTLHLPRRFALCILQETRAPGFAPAQGGVFADNLVVFESAHWGSGGLNTGPGTDPASFRFERNLWFCADQPKRTRALLALPAPELDGRYGQDPELDRDERGEFAPRAGSPAAGVGAHAFREASAERAPEPPR